MKKNGVYVLLMAFLVGCSANNLTTSSTTSMNDHTTIAEPTTSATSVNIEPSTSAVATTSNKPATTETTILSYNTISSIKEKAKEFVGKENSVGVYESDIEVNIKLKLLSTLDAITSKTGYGDRYKILMTDGVDYIYLKTTYQNYDYLKKYVVDQGVYNVKGNISLYNDEVEISVVEKPIYLASEVIDVNYEQLAKELTLEEIYAYSASLKLNCKGVSFSKIVKVNVKCLAKDINNENMYFGEGNYIINVHGHDKVTNKFTVGSSYTLFGAVQMYNFRPGLEYVSALACEEIDVNFDNVESKTASDFYKYQYETDEDATYPNYSSLFYHPYKITGYVNSYLKDNKEYIVLEDKYNENYYSTYQNARSAKAVFFVNENYVKLTSANSKYCPLYEHLLLGTKLEVVVFPYLWNTNDYPQVYSYSFNVLE